MNLWGGDDRRAHILKLFGGQFAYHKVLSPLRRCFRRLRFLNISKPFETPRRSMGVFHSSLPKRAAKHETVLSAPLEEVHLVHIHQKHAFVLVANETSARSFGVPLDNMRKTELSSKTTRLLETSNNQASHAPPPVIQFLNHRNLLERCGVVVRGDSWCGTPSPKWG